MKCCAYLLSAQTRQQLFVVVRRNKGKIGSQCVQGIDDGFNFDGPRSRIIETKQLNYALMHVY